LGDGKTGSGRVIEHVYDRGGSYRVTVTVNNQCDTQSASGDVVVAFPPAVKLYMPFVTKKARPGI